MTVLDIALAVSISIVGWAIAIPLLIVTPRKK